MATENKGRYGRYRNAGVGELLFLAVVVLGLALGLRACNWILNYKANASAAGDEAPVMAVASVGPQAKNTPPQRLRGVIYHVSDGDTADFRPDGGGEFRLRFYGIDAPENSQEFGAEARRYATQRLLKKRVEIVVRNEDQYGRKVSTVYLDGKDFCLELIAQGYAWHWARYYDNAVYARAMEQARTAKVGLWGAAAAAGHPAIPPWEYRKAHPRRGNKSNN